MPSTRASVVDRSTMLAFLTLHLARLQRVRHRSQVHCFLRLQQGTTQRDIVHLDSRH
jgi:hypothetical protein